MIPETGKLVPGRPPANSSEAKMTTASSRTTFRMLTHMGAGVELIPSCTRRAPLLENHGHCHDQAEQQGEVVVAGVRADLGQVPCTDRRETLRNRHRVRIPDDLVTELRRVSRVRWPRLGVAAWRSRYPDRPQSPSWRSTPWSRSTGSCETCGLVVRDSRTGRRPDGWPSSGRTSSFDDVARGGPASWWPSWCTRWPSCCGWLPGWQP